MEENVVTAQPVLSPNSEKPSTEISAMLNSNLDEPGNNIGKANEIGKEPLLEPMTEVTAVFNDTGDKENSEEEKKKRERRENAISDCCCPYSEPDDDVFCIILFCHWIGDCFRALGACTDSCFEDCANCLSSCCEDGDGSCLSCCDGNGDSGCCDDGCEGCGDCLSGCIDCCSACDSS